MSQINKGLLMKYFVLKPNGNNIYAKASREAMLRYAGIVQIINPNLADDLVEWVEKEQIIASNKIYGIDLWGKYRRTNIAEIRPYILGEDLSGINVAEVDDPKNDMGMIARNPKNHEDQWYVARKYFEENFKEEKR